MTRKKTAQLLLVLAGLTAVGLWFDQGDYQTTMAKAVRICMECIGIG